MTLALEDKRLDWIRGGVVWETYGRENACACIVESMPFVGDAVCVASETLAVYPQNGPEIMAHLPRPPKKIHNMKTGQLLLEFEDLALYVMHHPLGRLCPLEAPPGAQLIHFDQRSNMLVCFDSTGSHSVWLLRHFIKSDGEPGFHLESLWKQEGPPEVRPRLIKLFDEKSGRPALCLFHHDSNQMIILCLDDEKRLVLHNYKDILALTPGKFQIVSLPVTRPNLLDLLIVSSDGSMIIWDGEFWSLLTYERYPAREILTVTVLFGSLLSIILSDGTAAIINIQLWPESNMINECCKNLRLQLQAEKWHCFTTCFRSLKLNSSWENEWICFISAVLSNCSNGTEKLPQIHAIFNDHPSHSIRHLTCDYGTVNSINLIDGSLGKSFALAFSGALKDKHKEWSRREVQQLEGLARFLDENVEVSSPISSTGFSLSDLVCFIKIEANRASEPFTKKFANNYEMFPSDTRIQEVCKWLKFSKPTTIKSPDGMQSMSEQDILATQQTFLLMAANRTLCLPIGHSMLHFSSVQPPMADEVPFEKFDLSGRIPGTKSLVNFDPNILGQDYISWPEFHRGVAAVLQLAGDSYEKSMDSSWILFNRPQEPDAYHAGFLFGLGLNGRLEKLNYYHSFEYLSAKHDITSIGLLLGLAVAFLGTMNETVTKLISIHLPPFLPPFSTDLNLSSTLQASALVGMGLLYCETGHRRTAEIMAMEIGRKFLSVSDVNGAYRDSYALSAGFSLGMIMLGKGSNNPNPILVDCLRSYINGGKFSDAKYHQSQDLRDRPAIQALRNRFKDGDEINIHITACPAILALGLMFLRSENQMIAAIVDTPATDVLLENERPDLLIVREISYNIIMWSSIRADSQWLDSRALKSGKASPEKDNLRYCIIAGACFSIGLRYAGSGELKVCNFLLNTWDFVQSHLKESANIHTVKMGKTVLRLCINTMATACALVMTGTGDLKLLARLRKLHGRISLDTSYGDHMAIHMAIGLVCLGSARYSLNNSNRSLAALICAFYPIFPALVTDNRTHLQALRHLWVIAAERRCLVTQDANSGNQIQVPVTIYLKNGDEVNQATPCILPQLNSISALKICSPKHWVKTLDFETHGNGFMIKNGSRCLVRRKMGYSNRGKGLAENPFDLAELQSMSNLPQIYDDEILGFTRYFGYKLSDKSRGKAWNMVREALNK